MSAAMDKMMADSLRGQLAALESAIEVACMFHAKIGDAKPMTQAEISKRIRETTDAIVALGYHPETGESLSN